MSNIDLVIVNNEKVSKNEFYFCDNIDMKSIPEDLNKNFDVTLIVRNSKKDRKRKINLIKIITASNIFLFLLNIYKTFKKNNPTYLIISITPYTFFSYLLLFIFRKKIFVYLRSSGHEEYRAILGFFGPFIYDLMFRIVTFKSNIISCQERLLKKKKSHIVFPSELDPFWFENIQNPKLDKPRLLYVGRMKVEKGIFSLTKILHKINMDYEFSVVGGSSEKFSLKDRQNKKIIFFPFCQETNSLISSYDKNNIFILPSFTEAHPKVVDESLARRRPLIVFEEIKHVIKDRRGIFVCKRNKESLLETINFIMKNYKNIQESMKKNKLPTKKEFILQMSDILTLN